MTYPAIPCRLIEKVGQEFYNGAWWGDGCPEGIRDVDGHMQHSAKVAVERDSENESGVRIRYDWLPWRCERCLAPYDGEELRRHAGSSVVYNTESGKPEPGDLFFTEETHKCFHWDNCDGRHLHAVCPNGQVWDVDSRATNCNMPEDRTHRCWVREGEPPNVTAGKAGHTCTAGAGSILAGDYHGFLTNGAFTEG